MEQERIHLRSGTPISAAEVDAVLLTHAHMDHAGNFLLYKQVSRKIYATYATSALCDLMLRDSAHIQVSEAEWKS